PACTLRIFLCFSSRRRHTRSKRDWSSDVCSSDLPSRPPGAPDHRERFSTGLLPGPNRDRPARNTPPHQRGHSDFWWHAACADLFADPHRTSRPCPPGVLARAAPPPSFLALTDPP